MEEKIKRERKTHYERKQRMPVTQHEKANFGKS